MTFRKIVCIAKFTTYQFNHASKKKAKKFKTLPPLMQKRILNSHENHQSFLETLIDELETGGLKVIYSNEHELAGLNLNKNDLVISCGGDGTFLSCAQMFPQCKILGTNSDFQYENRNFGSKGALTSIDIRNVKGIGALIATKKWNTQKWRRLTASINGETLNNFSVNDIFFGPRDSYLTCSTRVEIENLYGSFLCSGIIACTGMGSHAWFRTAGGTPFSNELNAFGFIILHPSKNRENTDLAGIYSDKYSLKIRPNRDGYILAFDSKTQVIETLLDDEIEVYLDKKLPIQVIEFDR